MKVCTDFCKIPNVLLFGKRNSMLSKINIVDWCCVALTYVLFLDWKIHTMVWKLRADLTKTVSRNHISALNS